MLKISPTLLDAYRFYRTCPDSWKQTAYTQIVEKLERKPFQPTTAVQKGLDFESSVQYGTRILDCGGKLTGSDAYIDIVNRVHGCEWQVWTKKTLQVPFMEDMHDVRYIGKIDCLFRPTADFKGKIVDIKTTGRFREDKYRKGYQHLFYCLSENVSAFEYVVAEWETPDIADDYRVKALHTVPVTVDLQSVEAAVIVGIKEFFAFLLAKGLWETYVTVYSK